jgi:Asp-tRNA(Asn)/Glu-tRNA(Gln) amidotransferase A subunit family amidase
MARCAEDLGLALNVLAGPDDMESTGLELNLPAARHDAMRQYRVLVIRTHPLMPTSTEVGGLLDQMADELARAGAKVFDRGERLPSLEETARTYTKLFMSFAAASWPAELYSQVKMAVAAGPADLDTPRARRAQAAILSHRDWILADIRVRASLRKQWRDLFQDFDVVLSPVMPTPALPHDHLPDQEARRFFFRRRGIELRRSRTLAHNCQRNWLAVHGRSHRSVYSRPAGWNANHRSVYGRSDHNRLRGLGRKIKWGFTPPPALDPLNQES